MIGKWFYYEIQKREIVKLQSIESTSLVEIKEEKRAIYVMNLQDWYKV